MFAYILVFKNKENSKKKSNIIAECKLHIDLHGGKLQIAENES